MPIFLIFAHIKLAAMKLIFLSILGMASLSLNAQSNFRNKTEALDALNNSEIWVAGTPEYILQSSSGEMTVKLGDSGQHYYFTFNLAEVSFSLNTEGQIRVDIVGKDNKAAILQQDGRATQKVKDFSLIMQSVFSDGESYTDEYKKKGGQIVDALSYLARFYND